MQQIKKLAKVQQKSDHLDAEVAKETVSLNNTNKPWEKV